MTSFCRSWSHRTPGGRGSRRRSSLRRLVELALAALAGLTGVEFMGVSSNPRHAPQVRKHLTDTVRAGRRPVDSASVDHEYLIS